MGNYVKKVGESLFYGLLITIFGGGVIWVVYDELNDIPNTILFFILVVIGCWYGVYSNRKN